MKQQQFEQHHQAHWQRFGALLDALEATPAKTHEALSQFPALYRAVCGHYAMARERRYSSALVAELHELVQRGQRQLYRHRGRWLWRFAFFILYGFPATLRRRSTALWLALALFWLPALAMGLAAYLVPDSIYMIADPLTVAQFEAMYDPASEHLGRRPARAADGDFAMFAYYIWNNVSIGFRTFAGGILFGVGAVFFLVFNGVQIGGVAGFLTWRGFIETFWGFVAGHSAFELMAICICGAAGLVLAQALWIPGPYRRRDALRLAAGDAVQLLMGGMLLLFMAAFVEAYWSSMRSVPVVVKYAVGASLWLLLILYLALSGSWRESR